MNKYDFLCAAIDLQVSQNIKIIYGLKDKNRKKRKKKKTATNT